MAALCGFMFGALRNLWPFQVDLTPEIEKFKLELTANGAKYFQEFKENLLKGIDYYRKTAEKFVETKRTRFLEDLRAQKEALEQLFASLPLEKMAEATG